MLLLISKDDMIFTCDSILDAPGIGEYIQTRGIEKQYIKSKKYLIKGKFIEIDFHKRKPKTDDV